MQHPMNIPLVWLRRDRRPAFRTRALVAAVVLIALVAGAITWNSRHSSTLPISSEWTTKRLPELGIQFSYPSSWHLQSFDEMTGHAGIVGALVSNLDHEFEHPDLGPRSSTSAFDMRGLDESLVVLSFEQVDRFNQPAKETTGLPPDLAAAPPITDGTRYGAPQPRYYLAFAVSGFLHSGVHVYIGDVTDEERAAIDRILTSVKPIP